MPRKPPERSVRPLLLTTDPVEAWDKLEHELQLAGALLETDPDDSKYHALAAVVRYLCNRGLTSDVARRPLMEILYDYRDKGQKLTSNEKRLRAEVGAVLDVLMTTVGWLEPPAAEAVAKVLTKHGVKLGSQDPEVPLWVSVRNLRTRLLKRTDRHEWDVAWFDDRCRHYALARIDGGADRADFVLRRLEEILPSLKT